MQTSKPTVALPSGRCSRARIAALRSIIPIIPGVDSTETPIVPPTSVSRRPSTVNSSVRETPGSMARVSASLTAVTAGAVQHDVVLVDRVVDPSRQPLQRALQIRVLEGLYVAAAIAHHVVVVLAAGPVRLVALLAAAQVQALDELQLRERLE